MARRNLGNVAAVDVLENLPVVPAVIVSFVVHPAACTGQKV